MDLNISNEKLIILFIFILIITDINLKTFLKICVFLLFINFLLINYLK